MVTWRAGPGDTLASLTTLTGSDGIATNTVKLGPSVVARTVGATIPGGGSVTFTIKSAEMSVIKPAQSLINPMAQSSIVAPQAQLQNIGARLDELRLMRQPNVASGLTARFGNESVPLSMLKSLTEAIVTASTGNKPAGNEASAATSDSPTSTGKRAGGGASADDEPLPPPPAPKPPANWGVFVNGNFGIDRQDSVNNVNGFKLRTDGVTVGGDYRFPNNNILGASVGYIHGDTNINGGGSQDTTGFSFSMYGAIVPSDKTYINMIASYGHNRYQTHRQTDAGDTADGHTQGNQYAISVSAGYNFNKDAFNFNPYGRADLMVATIKGFSETSGTDPIRVSNQTIQSTVFTLGGQASYAFVLPEATVIPTFRLEFQQQTAGAPSTATAGLVNDPLNNSFAVPYIGQDKSYGNFGLGVLAIFKKGVSATFNYEQLFGKDNYSSQRFLLGLRVDF
jgi:outer membrane autotransporter protein